MELTPAEKGKITREQNRAAKQAQRAERAAEEKADQERAKAAMRAILTDDRATPQQRLDALKILDSLTHSYLIPLSVSCRDGKKTDKDLTAEFKAELEKLQGGSSPAE